jgi:DnaK suppressor protein
MVEKTDELKQMLLDMRGQILQEISKSIKTGADSVAGESTGDIYDQASSERDRELGLILNDRERQKLHQVDEALLRLADGEYGICEECEEEIPLGRLKAMPFTRHCVKCKADLEKQLAQTKRLEEERSYRDMGFADEEEA